MSYLQKMTLIMTLLSLFSCEAFGRGVKLSEPFTLKTTESATVSGTGIKITLEQVAKVRGVNPDRGEELAFSFKVKYDGQIHTYSYPAPEGIAVGKYRIKVVKAEPETSSAIFIVDENKDARNPADDAAAKFVEKFGWHIDEFVAPAKIELEMPSNFNGLPFYHYQSASMRSGVDMTPLLGKKVTITKYTLKEKQKDHEEDFTVFAYLIIENGRVAGAWRTDSSASAPGIYSFVKN